jgi:5-methyltetrahydropteroyltriglutamate--homocysteine methyltransferase
MTAPLFGTILPTTVVGSYPPVKGRGLFALVDPLKTAVETAVADQVAAGIDIISDGQVRADMIRSFASRLPGVQGQDVIGPVQPASSPITVRDTKYALTKHPKVKGIITGPSSLAHALHIATPAYRTKEELALDLAKALREEARHLAALGITILQIDEPILSTGVADLPTGREAVGIITSGLSVPVCLHVCGNTGSIVDDLLKMPVTILDFEFSRNPANLETIGKKDLAGKYVGYGCIDSTSDAVEPVEAIVRHIGKGVEVFSPDRMLIDPDCGMRMRTREAAFAKLSNMVMAAREVRRGL